jgi:hypothetical protein
MDWAPSLETVVASVMVSSSSVSTALSSCFATRAYKSYWLLFLLVLSYQVGEGA